MTTESTKTNLPDGIYLDLSFPEYLAQERMSSSGLTKLMEGPSAFWADSWMNPEREEDSESDAMKLGRAYHAARLEPETFEDLYCRELTIDDMPEGSLCRDVQYKEHLKGYGEPQTKAGETVLERAQRLEEIFDRDRASDGRPPVIWHTTRAAWEKAHQDKTWIAPKAWAEIERDAKRIRENPEVAALISEGVAEVSILWTDPESGIKCKCRPDYLGADHMVHLKTWDARSAGMPANRAIANNFQYNGHYRTGWFYLLGLAAMPDLKFRGPDGKTETLEAIGAIARSWLEHKPWTHWFMFVRRSGIPDVRARRVKWFGNPAGVDVQSIGADTSQFKQHPTALGIKAALEVQACFKLYQDCIELYGSEGAAWYPRDMMGDFEDADFSSYWLESTDDPR